MKNLKSEKGAITLFVLLACLFFIISLLGVYNYIQNRNQAANSEYEKVKENYEKDIGNEEKLYKSNIKPATLADLNIGDYVEYGVTYTDMYMGYEYTKINGWRILSKKANATNANLYDIELISTGIPANLYYYSGTVNNFEYDGTIRGKWAGTFEQRTAYANKFYLSRYSNDDNDYNNNNMYVAAGLYNNFEKIKFKVNSESVDSSYYNYGYYKNINGKTTEELDGNIFIDSSIGSKITGVRSVTLADLTGETDETASYTDKDGLYILQNLKNSTNASTHEVNAYTYSTGGYWVASPYLDDTDDLCYVSYSGDVDYTFNNTYGVRSVVSISGIQLINNYGVWQIVE